MAMIETHSGFCTKDHYLDEELTRLARDSAGSKFIKLSWHSLNYIENITSITTPLNSIPVQSSPVQARPGQSSPVQSRAGQARLGQPRPLRN